MLKKTTFDVIKNKKVFKSKYQFIFNMILVYILSFIYFSLYQFQSKYLAGNDGYYHIKFSYLLRTEGFIGNFKWATLSLWYNNFSDKEFLYHILLIPFTYFKDLQTGMKLASVVFSSFCMLSFYLVLKLQKIRYPFLWLLNLLASGGYFIYRVNLPRPHVLSIILVIWSIHFILENKRKHLAIICMFYPWTYTGYILPLIFSIITSTNSYFQKKHLEWKTPLTIFSFTIIGVLTHPYFPDNLTFFYVQNIYIPWMSITGNHNMLRMATEFMPMNTRNLLLLNTTVILIYFFTFFMTIAKPYETNVKVTNLFWISLFLILATAFSQRFTEYSMPVTLIFCALYLDHYLKNFNIINKNPQNRKKDIKQILIISITILFFFAWCYKQTAPLFNLQQPKFKKAAFYLAAHTNVDEVVYTCDWNHAPQLFFYNHKNRYQVFLDPNFMYYWDKSIWRKWNNLSLGHFGLQSYATFKNDFHVRYGVCTTKFSQLKNIIKSDDRMKIVYESDKVYVFKLEP